MVIGVFGTIGSGKSTVCKYLSYKYNFTYLELDRIAKDLEENNLELLSDLKKLKQTNNIDLINDENNKLDYSKMKAAIFNDYETNKIVSEIIWKYVKIYCENFINTHKKENIVIEAAILPVLKLKKIDYFFYVESNQFSRQDNLKIIDIQNIYNQGSRKDFIIKNESNVNDLLEQVDLIMNRILNKN